MSKTEARDARSLDRRPPHCVRAERRSTREPGRQSPTSSSVRIASAESRRRHQIRRSRSRALTADAVLSIEGLVGNIRGEQEQILAESDLADAGLRGRGEVGFTLTVSPLGELSASTALLAA